LGEHADSSSNNGQPQEGQERREVGSLGLKCGRKGKEQKTHAQQHDKKPTFLNLASCLRLEFQLRVDHAIDRIGPFLTGALAGESAWKLCKAVAAQPSTAGLAQTNRWLVSMIKAVHLFTRFAFMRRGIVSFL
jgi:hypothetical protein